MFIAFSRSLYMYILSCLHVCFLSHFLCRLYARLYLDFRLCVFALNMVMSLYFIFTFEYVYIGLFPPPPPPPPSHVRLCVDSNPLPCRNRDYLHSSTGASTETVTGTWFGCFFMLNALSTVKVMSGRNLSLQTSSTV